MTPVVLTPDRYNLDELTDYLLWKAFYRYPDLDLESLAEIVLGFSARTLYRHIKERQFDYSSIQVASPYRAVNVESHLKKKVKPIAVA